MARHAAPPSADDQPTPPSHYATPRRPPSRRLLVAGALVLLLVAGGIVWWAVGSSGDDAAAGCASRTPVRVTVAPELQQVTQQLLAAPVAYGGRGCAVAEVRAEEPLQTVGELQALQGSALPDVWVPDSSVWPARVDATPVQSAGSMATSPLVMATSRASAVALGWTGASPSWADVTTQSLAAGRALTMEDLLTSARQLGTSLAVQDSMGGGDQVQTAGLQALLEISRNPGPTLAEARDAAVRGDADAPVFGASEQDVIASHAASADSQLVAVYPSGSTPELDYPIERVGSPGDARTGAVDAVVAALSSKAAFRAVRDAGFRDPDGGPPTAAGDPTGTRAQAPAGTAVDPGQVKQLTDRVTLLSEPSQFLTVIDTSTSMNAPAGDGTRITLARDAAKSALTLLPDTYSVALWTFAFHVDGDRDYLERVPLRALDADVSGTQQRDALNGQLDALPSELAPGGTGLYDTTLAAVRAARDAYRSGSVSSVVLLTDGADDDDAAGISLPGLLDTLRGEADPARPVKVIAVGIGPDADQDALQQIATATGGAAYSAVDPDDLQGVLFDAVKNR